MPTGLSIPVGVNKSGGARVETNESKQLRKMLILALSTGGDRNPFQQLGLDPKLIWSVNNVAFRGKAQRALNAILAKFSDRVELSPNQPIKFEKGDKEGEIVMSFEYVDKLTDKVEDFRSPFTRQG